MTVGVVESDDRESGRSWHGERVGDRYLGKEYVVMIRAREYGKNDSTSCHRQGW